MKKVLFVIVALFLLVSVSHAAPTNVTAGELIKFIGTEKLVPTNEKILTVDTVNLILVKPQVGLLAILTENESKNLDSKIVGVSIVIFKEDFFAKEKGKLFVENEYRPFFDKELGPLVIKVAGKLGYNKETLESARIANRLVSSLKDSSDPGGMWIDQQSNIIIDYAKGASNHYIIRIIKMK